MIFQFSIMMQLVIKQTYFIQFSNLILSALNFKFQNSDFEIHYYQTSPKTTNRGRGYSTQKLKK